MVGLYEIHGSADDNSAEAIAKKPGLPESSFIISGVVLRADSERFDEIQQVELGPERKNRNALIARGSGGGGVAAKARYQANWSKQPVLSWGGQVSYAACQSHNNLLKTGNWQGA